MDEYDYFSRHSLFGGSVDDIPLPHVRMFPNSVGRLREVTCTLNTWVGVGVGATHYYAKVKEEDNPIWGEFEGRWTYAWDDGDKAGRCFEKSCDTQYQAAMFVQNTLVEHFLGDKYEIKHDSIRTFHLYLRDGD